MLSLNQHRKISKKTVTIVLLTGLLFLYFSYSLNKLSPYLTSGAELIKIRNSLLLEVGVKEDFDWIPTQEPISFRKEKSPPGDHIRQLASKIIRKDQSAWNTTIAIARHLLSHPSPTKNAIKRDSVSSYYLIVNDGAGYCADFTQVFTALALAADINVREWGFSDSEFGGGHAFTEIYSYEYRKWMFIDVFNSFYTTDTNGVPLSVQELRKRLLNNNFEAVAVNRIIENRFGFRDSQQALTYYQDGAAQMYLWWGNNIYTYENGLAARWFGFSRHIEQAVAILLDQHLKIKALPNHISVTDLKGSKEIKRAFQNIVLAGCTLFLILSSYLCLRFIRAQPKA